MTKLLQKPNLEIDRCPHCNIAKPLISRLQVLDTQNHSSSRLRHWSIYACRSCGGVIVTAVIDGQGDQISEIYPIPSIVDETIPDRARSYLTQAIESIHAPAGAIMLAASAVDAMLKAKGFKEGSLNSRIDKVASEHLITEEMAAWAHEVRIDANEQRHSDEDFELPNETDATKIVEFTRALAEFLFVLPARVERGRRPKIS